MARKPNPRAKAEKHQYVDDPTEDPQGLGPESAGQSGDLQGLSEVPDADSESVDELVEEGQALEADVIEGVEEASGTERTPEVHTHERPEDDVPPEYRDRD
jgi:hypothetical protein